MSETYRLLLDENTEFDILTGMLTDAGHDVEIDASAISTGRLVLH